MLSQALLDWALWALSFFNTVALLWLGLTVLLNAERRVWGTWVAGGGLVLGGLFFAAHSALVGGEFGSVGAEMEFWWRAGWLLFLTHPFMWYLTIAWYTGVLDTRRHRLALFVLSALGLTAVVILGLVQPLPAYGALARDAAGALAGLGSRPRIVLVFPLFSALCVALALDALLRPGASDRFMGDLGRRRARGWLVAASLVLLVVSLAIGVVADWFLRAAQSGQISMLSPANLALLSRLDLLISVLLAVSVVLMGRAIVSYEIFTGKILPRGGLFCHWRNSLLLAAGYGTLLAASLVLPVDPIYRLLLATVLMTLFFALLSWRSYVEREESMARLRPFVASQRLYEHLLRPAVALDVDAAAPLRALCAEVLGARLAYLAALGPLAPFVGPPLAYPNGVAPPLPALAKLSVRFHGPQMICLAVDPALFGGAVWAVPLWSERGLIGVLLLGEKHDGGLYAHEEIEIARTIGERLIDTQASAEMARRLMGLQRQRLAESQVLDQRTRLALHDDVLPRLHTTLLALRGAGDSAATREAVVSLADVHHRIAKLLRAMPSTATPEVARLGLLDALRQALDAELAGAFDEVRWTVAPDAAQLARNIPPLTAEVLYGAAREAIRNAARHGRDRAVERPLRLAVGVGRPDGLEIVIEDDGVGLEQAGAPAGGQGLALHGTMMAVVGGTLTLEMLPAGGTRVVLRMPPGDGI